MVFDMALDPLGAALILGGGMVLLLGAKFIVEFIQEDDTNEALENTFKWAAGGIAAFAGAVGVGMVQFADVAGMIAMFLGQHPFAASNLGIAGLGAAVMGGLLSLTWSQYLGISLLLIGGVMVAVEANDGD